MSAFVVSKEHVDAMVSVALDGPAGVAVRPGYWPRPFRYFHDGESREVRSEDADTLGQMLWGTNALSVRTRYPDLYEGGDYPGPVGFDVEDVYEYRYTSPSRRPTAVEALKLIRCFEYQSCEFSGWEEHAAAAFCRSLTEHVIAVLPGYDEAPWEWSDERVSA